jgi:hypothetical protein
MYRSIQKVIGVTGFVFLVFNFSDVRAQVYGTDYLSFQGRLIVLDNPTSAGCQAVGINYGSAVDAVYLFTVNPSLIADALTTYPQGGRAGQHMVSTQSPNFSLAGLSTTITYYVNSYGNAPNTPGVSSSNLTILSGLNQPVSLAAGNIKILGSISNFLGNSGCTVGSVHGALVAVPF